jgi:deoxyribonuclease-4
MATLRAGAALRASGVVTHVGSHLGRGYDQVAERVADALGEVLAATPHEVDLVLENSAGAGGIIGSSLPELGGLLQRADEHPRLKVALDTAHLCAAGWDFQEPGAAERLVRELDRQVGRERLVLVHANDSRAPCGSRKDRHANIGDGAIGLEGFRRLVAQPALQRVPWILETPDLDRRVEDLANLRALSVELLSTTVPSDKVKT